MSAREMRRVQDSVSQQVHVLTMADINGVQRLFGGRLMSWIDEVSVVVARRHSGRNVTTVLIDKLEFKAAAHANDTLVLLGQMTYAGRTSMEVRVDTYVERLNGQRDPVNRAYLVMVALDENGEPTEVPGLVLETEEERAEWADGERRRLMRKERRARP